MMRAKFKVTKVDRYNNPENTQTYNVTVYMDALTEQDDDLESFWQYTPGGQLHITITNPNLFNQFEENQVYYLDFTEFL